MSGFITTQTYQVGEILTIAKDASWHKLPVGQKVVITSAQTYTDVVGSPVPLSTEIDPYSYGVKAIDPAPGVINTERFLASDEVEKVQ